LQGPEAALHLKSPNNGAESPEARNAAKGKLEQIRQSIGAASCAVNGSLVTIKLSAGNDFSAFGDSTLEGGERNDCAQKPAAASMPNKKRINSFIFNWIARLLIGERTVHPAPEIQASAEGSNCGGGEKNISQALALY